MTSYTGRDGAGKVNQIQVAQCNLKPCYKMLNGKSDDRKNRMSVGFVLVDSTKECWGQC